MIIAATDRLILRPFHASDGEAMNRVFGDAEVMQYGDGVKSRDWVREWLRGWIDDYYTRWGFGMWAVVERRVGDVVGYCGLSRFTDRC